MVLAVTLAGGAKATPTTIQIVDLVIDYDDAVWRVNVDPVARPLLFPAVDGPVLAIFNCAARGCRENSAVFVSASPVERDSSPLAVINPDDSSFTRPLWDDDAFAREINGLIVFAQLTFSGCRARSPSELRAEIDHAGLRYRFASGVALGCGGVSAVGDDAFLNLISGIRPAG